MEKLYKLNTLEIRILPWHISNAARNAIEIKKRSFYFKQKFINLRYVDALWYYIHSFCITKQLQ